MTPPRPGSTPLGTRRRDPERTKRALLDAALAEFAEKGLAGARVDQIATRAGVNKQLISYHFGAKEGLHRALASAATRERMRFSLREALDQDSVDVAFEADTSEVATMRDRREAGRSRGARFRLRPAARLRGK